MICNWLAVFSTLVPLCSKQIEFCCCHCWLLFTFGIFIDMHTKTHTLTQIQTHTHAHTGLAHWHILLHSTAIFNILPKSIKGKSVRLGTMSMMALDKGLSQHRTLLKGYQRRMYLCVPVCVCVFFHTKKRINKDPSESKITVMAIWPRQWPSL